MKLKINKQSIILFGKAKGSYSNKFNRIYKLALMHDSLLDKFDSFIKRGKGTSIHAECALACKLLLTTGIRIGNEGSAEGYVSKNNQHKGEFVQTYGLTTLKREHIKIRGNNAFICFLGKRQVNQSIKVCNINTVEQMKTLIGGTKNNNGCNFLSISDYDLRKFIQKYVGNKFQAKDFRTLRANIDAYLYAAEIMKRPTPKNKSSLRAEVKEILVHVSEILGNTPSVCKKSYVDERLIDYFITNREDKN